MHIVVYGVGAVGGFYGAMLARGLTAEHQLSFIARGKTLELLKTQGIELVRSAVSDFGEDKHDDLIKLAVNAYASIDELSSPADVVLVCVKSKDTITVAEALKNKLGDNAYAVSVQNGVENEEKLASVLGAGKVLGCLTTVAAENLSPGKYIQKARYEIIFGELPGSKNLNRAEVLKEIMRAAGINAKTTDDIYKSLWTKLVWNTGFNPLSALYELEIGPLIAEHKETILGLMQETVATAHAQGIMIRGDAASWHFDNTNTQAWASFRTSMMQDALAAKPIELDDILGVLIRRGREYGVETPVAQKVHDLCVSVIANSGGVKQSPGCH
jgi:2-dehydropantoate 2-reductase